MDAINPCLAHSSSLTPLRFLELAATAYADCPFIIYNKSMNTWSQTNRRCLRLAFSVDFTTGDVFKSYNRPGIKWRACLPLILKVPTGHMFQSRWIRHWIPAAGFLPSSADEQFNSARMEALKPFPANSSPLTPLRFLELAATAYPDCPSIIYNKSVYTWSQTHRRCLRLASSLASLGITTGDVVSVVAPNVPAMYEMHFGVPMCGAIFNAINTRLDAHTIASLLTHSEAKLVFVDIHSRYLLEDAVARLSRKPMLVFIEDAEACEIKFLPSELSYEKLIERGDPDFRWVRPESEWAPMILNYTSGTSAAPKGVVHCHRALFLVTLDSLVMWGVPHQPVFLWTLPMFHANGWSYPWGMAAVGGVNVCLRKFDSSTIFSVIAEHKVTHMCGAPVVLSMLTSAPPGVCKTLTHRVDLLTAGSPPPAAVLLRVESLGFCVTHGYGLTETAGLIVVCAWKGQWDRYPAAERARLKARQGVGTLSTTEVDVINTATGESVKRDGATVGEIVLRGGSLMLGYLKDSESTRKAVGDDGWFYTGDVAVLHPDGYLEIKDRSKDVIISGGENISSVAVESVLYSHPAVKEAAVVARPDLFWGETPCAFLSLKMESRLTDGVPSEKEIIAFCREKLPHFMVPRTVVFVDDLPKTSTGKVQKFVLRDIAKNMGSLSDGISLL